jgi:hypothetical protein
MRKGSIRVIATASLLGWSVLPLDSAWAEQQPFSSPTTSTVPENAQLRSFTKQAQTPDEHMEELRIGLEQLARSYASQEAHMAQLRLGLERLARSINSVGN